MCKAYANQQPRPLKPIKVNGKVQRLELILIKTLPLSIGEF